MEKKIHRLFVCTTCASTWQDGKRIGKSGGDRLFAELLELHQNWNLKAEFLIEPVSCMSACSRSCVVSFSASGKYTYLFGELSESVATAILDCASSYHAHSQGNLPWSERPEPLKKGILAKIPTI